MALGIMVGNRIDNGVIASSTPPPASNLQYFPNSTHSGTPQSTFTWVEEGNFSTGSRSNSDFSIRVTSGTAQPIMKVCVNLPNNIEYTSLNLRFWFNSSRNQLAREYGPYTQPAGAGIRNACNSKFVVPLSNNPLPAGDYWGAINFTGRLYQSGASFPFYWTVELSS